MAHIEFKQEPDGSVSYALVTQKGELFDRSYLAALHMAKRGLTKRDTEKYRLNGYFEMKVEE